MTTENLLLKQPVDGQPVAAGTPPQPWSEDINSNMDTIDSALATLNVRVSNLELANGGGEATRTAQVTFNQAGAFTLPLAPGGIVAGSIPVLTINGLVQDGSSATKRFEVQTVNGVKNKLQLLPYDIVNNFTKVNAPTIRNFGSNKIPQMQGNSDMYLTGVYDMPDSVLISASTTYGNTTHPAFHAVDRNPATFWASAVAPSVQSPQWWQVNFKYEPVTVDRINIRSRQDGYHYQSPASFKIFGSNDDMATSDLLYEASSLTWSGGEVKQFSFPAGSYKTIRIHVTSNTVGYDPCAIAEVELLNSADGRNALSVTGNNVVTADNGDLAVGSGDFTVEAWVKIDALTNGWNTILASRPWDAGFSDAYAMGVAPDGSIAIYTASFFPVRTGANAFPLGVWNHVAWVRTGTTLKIYLNGTHLAYGEVANNFSRTTFTVGGNPNGGYPLNGAIRNVRITKAARYTDYFTPPSINLKVSNDFSDPLRESTPLKADFDSLVDGNIVWNIAGKLVPDSSSASVVTYRAVV